MDLLYTDSSPSWNFYAYLQRDAIAQGEEAEASEQGRQSFWEPV